MTPDDRKQFLLDALAGLSADAPELPCKYLYDERGSALFEAICATDEYYVTRADLALHQAHADEIVAAIGPEAHFIELGSGAGIKIRTLLQAAQNPRAYTAIEISRDALAQANAALQQQFPELEIHGLVADYTQPIDAEVFQLEPPARRRVVYFPGSTISNFTHDQAREFLLRMGRMAGPDGRVLIGVDLVKPIERLIRAYDDAEGVTAAFNLNLLQRLRDDLGARLEIDDFAHEARYNEVEQRIEMHLVAQRDSVIELGGRRFAFRRGDSIHTENSHKYSIESFTALLDGTGLRAERSWTDPEGLFSMHDLAVD
jgi:dimethylhistidine N-methyltransferase